MGSNQASPALVRFGLFEADLRAGELRRKGVKVRLQDLPFRALSLLLSRPGVVITREEFRQALWPPDVFVDFEQGISSAIMRLRDALKDSADNPVFIETIERRGYRWIAPVVRPEGQAAEERAELPDAPSEEALASAPTAVAVASETQRLRLRVLAAVAAVVVVLGLGGFFLWRSLLLSSSSLSAIAVLPFDNLSAPTVDDAFSDGLTDEVASSVSHLEGIRVTGRRSAYVFKGKHGDLREIGSRLNVDAIVEGSVQRVGDHTRVNVELNRTRDGITLWSQTFDGNSSDWFQIESEIASSIARALARNVAASSSTHPPDSEAHALYLQARYEWNRRNFASELKSVDLMQQAIARDPGYALAWAGLADSLAVIGDNEEVDPAAYMPRARDAALKALQLDPSLAEAHAVLGMVACHYDYDWLTAEREYKKAFELNPSYPSAHQYYALGLMAHGRFAEAEEQLSRARKLDPLALIVDVDLAVLRKYQRNYEGAISVSQSILQRDPTFQLGYSMLAAGYFCEGRWAEWLATDAKVRQDDVLRAIANGRPDEAHNVLQQYVKQADAGLRRPYDVFNYSVKVGDKEQALLWLEKAFQHRDYWMLFINVDPEMDPVRSDPQFQEIVKRLGVAN